MNYKILFNLIAVPTVLGSMLAMMFMVNKVSASAVAPATTVASCDTPSTPQVQSSLRHGNSSEILLASGADSSLLDFSIAESDAAVTLFGCDCPSCIQALRQLKAQPSSRLGQGHCWSAIQGNFSTQVLQEVLNTLDATTP
ncbi:MAG: hypothetical protein VKJ02_04500 [Snowella sp.]|nr:hypothetical protein [Snowella sp.]